MAQSLAALDWSAVAWTSRRPQLVEEAPAYSCSLSSTASGDLARDELEFEGADDLLQATEAVRLSTRRIGGIFMTRGL